MSLPALKQLNDAALAFCRQYQSPQTHFVHYYPELPGKGLHHTIPIAENFLFALALLKTRQSEQVIEAKELLKKLINFTVDAPCGNSSFPTFMHEYPECGNKLIGLRIIPSLYWMLRIYSSVLGADLSAHLRRLLGSLARQCLYEYGHVEPSYALCFRTAIFLQAAGTLCEEGDLQEAGVAMAATLSGYDHTLAWNSPRILSELLIALQMADSSAQEAIGAPLWLHIEKVWHKASRSFAGLPAREYMNGYNPELTPYHLYMMAASERMPEHFLQTSYVHLEALLFHQIHHQLTDHPALRSAGTSRIGDWIVINQADYGMAAIAVSSDEPLLKSDGFHPFRMVWANGQKTEVLVCQGISCAMTFEEAENGLDLLFHYDFPPEVDHRLRCRELQFYLNVDEKTSILVEGSRATTFELGDTVAIACPTLAFSLSFEIDDGEGSLVGHIVPGNRPSQLISQDASLFTPYDWQIFLRTIRRSAKCRLKAKIRPRL